MENGKRKWKMQMDNGKWKTDNRQCKWKIIKISKWKIAKISKISKYQKYQKYQKSNTPSERNAKMGFGVIKNLEKSEEKLDTKWWCPMLDTKWWCPVLDTDTKLSKGNTSTWCPVFFDS